MSGKPPYLSTVNMTCAECGMLCDPAGVFHPWLYCWLRKRGVLDPGRFLREQGFIPDPARWTDAKDQSQDGAS